MNNRIQILLMGLIVLLSCKKVKDIPYLNEIPNTIDLYRYNTGNFWIYRVIETPEDSTMPPRVRANDTVFVVGDSTIRGNIYKKIRSRQSLECYRDSMGFLINSWGRIVFSTQFRGTAYNHYAYINYSDTLFKYFDIVDGRLKDYMTPTMGNFKTYTQTRFYTLFVSSEKIMRASKSYYAPGFGKVYYEDFFVGTKRGVITSELIQIGKR